MSSLTQKEKEFLRRAQGIKTPEEPSEVGFLSGVKKHVFWQDSDALQKTFDAHGPLNRNEFLCIEQDLIPVFLHPKNSAVCDAVCHYLKYQEIFFYDFFERVWGNLRTLDAPETTRLFVLDLIFKHSSKSCLQTFGLQNNFFERECDILFALSHERFLELQHLGNEFSSGTVENFFDRAISITSEPVMDLLVPHIQGGEPFSLWNKKCDTVEKICFLLRMIDKHPVLLKTEEKRRDTDLLGFFVSKQSVFEQLFKHIATRNLALSCAPSGEGLVTLLKELPVRQAVALFKAKRDDWERVTYYRNQHTTLLAVLARAQHLRLLKVAARIDPDILSRPFRPEGTTVLLDFLSDENKTIMSHYVLQQSVRKTQQSKPYPVQRKM